MEKESLAEALMKMIYGKTAMRRHIYSTQMELHVSYCIYPKV